MNKKLAILVVVIVGIIAFGCKQQSAIATVTVPALPPGHLAPPRTFLQDWQDFQALQDQIKTKEKETNIRALYDQLNGMATRLQSQVPAGYTWQEATKSFAPIPVPQQPAPVPAPAPAPAPKK